jgi:hypothetical protein
MSVPGSYPEVDPQKEAPATSSTVEASRSCCSCRDQIYPHQFNLTQPSLLCEERFEWAVETKQSEPALARYGLNPVAPLQARRLTRTEIDRRGAVGVRFCGGRRVALAASARSVLESNPTYASRGEVVLMRNGSFNAHKHSLAMPLAAVPELTRNGGINLNGRVSLRRI